MVHESEARQRIGAHLIIHGSVQGVGYRFFAQELARVFGLGGWVRNLPDRNVEAFVEGPRQAIEAFIKRLEKGPQMSQVETVTVDWQTPPEHFTSFSILS